MSRMGDVVQEIMEMYGEVPKGYTLKDYFRDVKKKKSEKPSNDDGTSSNNILAENQEKAHDICK